jgi:hypothetical protein
VIRYGQYRRKESRIVKREGKYGRKANRIVKRHDKYGRKVGNSETTWTIWRKTI